MIGVVLWFDELLEVVLPHAIGANSRLHGLEHWRRVHNVGLELAARTPGADPEVVAAFAVFHDSLRVTDGVDPRHGARGARLADALVTWLDGDSCASFYLPARRTLTAASLAIRRSAAAMTRTDSTCRAAVSRWTSGSCRRRQHDANYVTTTRLPKRSRQDSRSRRSNRT